MFPLHKVHNDGTQENSYPSYIFFGNFFFFLHSFSLTGKKKKRARKIRKNPQKCNGMSASKLL